MIFLLDNSGCCPYWKQSDIVKESFHENIWEVAMSLPEYPMMSIEDYLILDDNSKDARYEYLDGDLRMLAGGSIYHSMLCANVTGILYTHLSNSSCSVYNSDIRLQLSASQYVYPDVTVSCDQRDQKPGNTLQYPSIVFEVLSPSTEVIDCIKKLAYYRACPTIQEYIMIDSQQVLIDVYHRQGKQWTLETLGLEDGLVLESLNIQIPVKDIYKKITFA
jgi:Uma2 family endonuclease